MVNCQVPDCPYNHTASVEVNLKQNLKTPKILHGSTIHNAKADARTGHQIVRHIADRAHYTRDTLPSAHLNSAPHKTSTVNSCTKYRSATLATGPSRSVQRPAQSNVLAHVRVPNSMMAGATNIFFISLEVYHIYESAECPAHQEELHSNYQASHTSILHHFQAGNPSLDLSQCVYHPLRLKVSKTSALNLEYKIELHVRHWCTTVTSTTCP